MQVLDVEFFLAPGHAAEGVQDQAADRVAVLVAEARAELGVEIFDRGLRLDPEAAELVLTDVVLGFVEIVLVLDVADDLFEDVLDGHQAADSGVFVDDNGHMVVRDAEFAQQDVQSFRFGDEHRGAQPVAQVERLVLPDAQQVLGEQDADHVVAVLLNDRKTRMGRAVGLFDDPLEGIFNVDDLHPGARHHHVAHDDLGSRQGALGDRQGVGIEQLAFVSRVQQLDQLLPVFRFAEQQGGKAFKECRSVWVHFIGVRKERGGLLSSVLVRVVESQ